MKGTTSAGHVASAGQLLASWSEMDLDRAFLVCLQEPWADRVLTEVLGVLAPALRARGFDCAVPDEQFLVGRQFGAEFAGMNMGRRLTVTDPLGAADGRCLRASVGVGVVARFGSPVANESGEVVRDVRITGSVSLGIGYTTPEGWPLPEGGGQLGALKLVVAGAELVVGDVSQLTDWLRKECGLEQLQPSAPRVRQLLPSVMPALMTTHPEPVLPLAERLDALVERCVAEMAP